jgi:hypothetical protein
MITQSDNGEPSKQPPKDSSSAKPVKVLSTSLGLMLAGHLLLAPTLSAEVAPSSSPSSSPSSTPVSTPVSSPQLVEWSSEEVKAYYNASVDWSIPLPKLEADKKEGQPTPTPSVGGTSGGNTPIIINNGGSSGGGFFGGGFGWDDLLLYHMIFNRGNSYSSNSWVNNRPSYDYRTNQPYVPQTYDNRSFANQTKANLATPRTNSRSGSFSTNKSSGSSSSSSSSSTSASSSSKSTSTSSGSIGGKSSSFSSSSGG